jgi:YidC/Oxa1 family membrane protein insertase
MPEPVNDGGSKPEQPAQGPQKAEMSMETRLLIAFLLMGAVLFTMPYFYKSVAPPPPKKISITEKAPAEPNPAAPAASPAAPAPAAKAGRKGQPTAAGSQTAAAATPQNPEPPFVIETDLYKIAFSNQGATVRSWLLKKYRGNDNKLLDLVNGAANLAAPFALYFPAEKPAANVNAAYFTQKGDPDGLGVTYEYSDGHASVRKTFRFQKNSYRSQVTTEATLDGQPAPNLIEWRGGFGDSTIASPAASERTLYFDVAQNKLVEETVKAAKNGPASSRGPYSFAGIADAYFVAVFLPEGNPAVDAVTFSDPVPTPLDKNVVPMVGTAVGVGGLNRFTLFVGPKDLDTLRKVNPKLEQVVDFGWLAFLAKPLFLIVNWIDERLVHNYGWSIVLVTIVINFALFPLKMANMKSMRKMQALQPQIAAINERFKNIGLRDPRKAEQNQEVMELYKKHGVNPMGGCVPMLLQIPFFFAFYKVFTVSVEMRGANWLWVTDLSQPEHLAIRILPVVMIASQFWMQKMTPQANVDPNQQRMMMLMPLIFGFMFYSFPSGLVLYYLTSNLVSMGQQWFFNHTAAADEAARSVQVKKKNGRK